MIILFRGLFIKLTQKLLIILELLFSMHHYATLDDSLRKINLGSRDYEVEVHCLCDDSDNVNYLVVLKSKHKRVNTEILKTFLEENLEDCELYACSFYKPFDLPVTAYINKKTRRKQPKEIRNLFKKADQGARRHSKDVVSIIKYSGLQSLEDLRRKGNIGNLGGIELLLLGI